MKNPNFRLAIHIIGQIIAQTAVIAVVPDNVKPYFAAFAAVVGVLMAFADQSLSQ